MFLHPVGYGLFAPDILKTVLMFCFFTLLGQVGTNNPPYTSCLVATQAAFSLKDLLPVNECFGTCQDSLIRKDTQVAFSTGGFNIWWMQQWKIPMGKRFLPEGIDPVQGPSLTTMTDCSSKFLDRVLDQELTRMHGMRLRSIRHGRIFHPQVAGHTTVRPVYSFRANLVYPQG